MHNARPAILFCMRRRPVHLYAKSHEEVQGKQEAGDGVRERRAGCQTVWLYPRERGAKAMAVARSGTPGASIQQTVPHLSFLIDHTRLTSLLQRITPCATTPLNNAWILMLSAIFTSSNEPQPSPIYSRLMSQLSFTPLRG